MQKCRNRTSCSEATFLTAAALLSPSFLFKCLNIYSCRSNGDFHLHSQTCCLWSRSQPSVLPSTAPQICSRPISLILSFQFMHPPRSHTRPLSVKHASSPLCAVLIITLRVLCLLHTQPYSMKLGHIPLFMITLVLWSNRLSLSFLALPLHLTSTASNVALPPFINSWNPIKPVTPGSGLSLLSSLDGLRLKSFSDFWSSLSPTVSKKYTFYSNQVSPSPGFNANLKPPALYPWDLPLLTKVTDLLFIWSDRVARNPCYLVSSSERVCL